MARDYLGGFEQIVLAAVLQTHGDAYAVTIHRAIKDRTRRVTAHGQRLFHQSRQAMERMWAGLTMPAGARA